MSSLPPSERSRRPLTRPDAGDDSRRGTRVIEQITYPRLHELLDKTKAVVVPCHDGL